MVMYLPSLLSSLWAGVGTLALTFTVGVHHYGITSCMAIPSSKRFGPTPLALWHITRRLPPEGVYTEACLYPNYVGHEAYIFVG